MLSVSSSGCDQQCFAIRFALTLTHQVRNPPKCKLKWWEIADTDPMPIYVIPFVSGSVTRYAIRVGWVMLAGQAQQVLLLVKQLNKIVKSAVPCL